MVNWAGHRNEGLNTELSRLKRNVWPPYANKIELIDSIGSKFLIHVGIANYGKID